MSGRIEREGCDACGPNVMAYVFIEMPSGLPLAYCVHHANIFEDRLREQGAVIHDYRYILEGEERNG